MPDLDDRYIEVTPAQQEALRSRVLERMRDRNLTQAQLQRRTRSADQPQGASLPTVRAVMRGTPGRYWRSKLRLVADGLGWTGDSIERILAGSAPIEATAKAGGELDLDERFTSLEARMDRFENALSELRRLLEQGR